MKRIILLSVFFLMIIPRLRAQYNANENKVWAFGIFVGLDFNSGVPVPFTTGMQMSEGPASVCDAAGNLLFYSHGNSVFNNTGVPMPSGMGMVSFGIQSTTQGALIVPLPGSPNIYYLFSLEWTAGNIAPPPVGRLVYSIVDMFLDGGLGDVTTAAIPITSNLSEKMIAVRGNACNIWVLTHSKDSAIFRAYEITAAGINLTPVVSAVGSFSGVNCYAAGVMKVSHDRARIVTQCLQSTAAGARGTELYDFNATTGVVSNCRVLDNTRGAYGAEFSPDNTKLYTDENVPGLTTVSQYNIALPTTAAIIASRYIVSTYPLIGSPLHGDLKLAADNKIYRISDFTPPTINRYLDIINSPNSPGAACGFVPQALNISPNWVVYGLPNTVWTVHYDTFHVRHDTAGCFSAGSATIASSVTGTAYSWYDGVTTATHTISGPGTYWVAVYNACDVTIDTIVVHAAAAPPPPVISGDTVYCYGDTFVSFIAFGTGILWYPSATSTTGSATPPIVNTTMPGTYTFYATQTIDCESAKASITITVLPKVSPSFSYLVHHGCITDTVHFTNTTAGVNTYSWNFGDHSPADTGSLSVTHIYPAHGVYSVTLTAQSAAGCVGDTTIVIDTRYPINAGFTILPDTLCAGAAATFTMSSPASAITKYRWSFGDGDTAISTINPAHTYSFEGVFPVSLSIIDTAGCADSLTKNVYVLGVRIKTFHDTTLCVSSRLRLSNEVILLPGNISTDFSFHWTPAEHLSDTSSQMPYYTGIGLTTYTFTATINPYGCKAEDTVRIHGVPGKPLTRVSRDTTILLGGSAQLNSWNEILYRWAPNDGSLNNPNINNPIATPTSSTLYTVYGYDADGCQDSAFVMIYVDSGMAECIPTGFTPNGDGLNDVFRPLCLRHQKVVEFNIYNRWGELVFHATSVEKGWDGTYKGVPQEMGVYYYMITIARNMQNIMYKGDVTLIR